MPSNDRLWTRFNIQAVRDPVAADARRVVFELADSTARARAGRSAIVILRAGGELIVRYVPPESPVPGLERHDYIRRAVEVVQALPE